MITLEEFEDALDGLEEMIGYVPEYFQQKWDHQGFIDRARVVLAREKAAGL